MASLPARYATLLHLLPLIAVLGMTACGDDPTELADRSFCMQLTITDPGGNPAPGLRISAWSRLPPEFTQDGNLSRGGSKPATTFSFEIAQDCRVIYRLFDVTGEETCTLLNAMLPASAHQVVWNGWTCNHPESVPVIAGAYRAVFEAWDPDTDELLYTDEVVPVLYLADPDLAILGYADAAGKFTTTWKQFFPHLYDWEPFMAVDEQGNQVGTFSYLDLARITLTDTSAHLSQSIDVVVEDGPNSLALTWNPDKTHSWQTGGEMKKMTRPLVTQISQQTFGPSTGQVPTFANKQPDQPPFNFRVRQNFPNPFN